MIMHEKLFLVIWCLLGFVKHVPAINSATGDDDDDPYGQIINTFLGDVDADLTSTATQSPTSRDHQNDQIQRPLLQMQYDPNQLQRPQKSEQHQTQLQQKDLPKQDWDALAYMRSYMGLPTTDDEQLTKILLMSFLTPQSNFMHRHLLVSRIYETIDEYKQAPFKGRKILGWNVNLESVCSVDNEIKRKYPIIKANRLVMIFKAITSLLTTPPERSPPDWKSAQRAAKKLIQKGFPWDMMHQHLHAHYLEQVFPLLANEQDQEEYFKVMKDVNEAIFAMIRAAGASKPMG